MARSLDGNPLPDESGDVRLATFLPIGYDHRSNACDRPSPIGYEYLIAGLDPAKVFLTWL